MNFKNIIMSKSFLCLIYRKNLCCNLMSIFGMRFLSVYTQYPIWISWKILISSLFFENFTQYKIFKKKNKKTDEKFSRYWINRINRISIITSISVCLVRKFLQKWPGGSSSSLFSMTRRNDQRNRYKVT